MLRAISRPGATLLLAGFASLAVGNPMHPVDDQKADSPVYVTETITYTYDYAQFPGQCYDVCSHKPTGAPESCESDACGQLPAQKHAIAGDLVVNNVIVDGAIVDSSEICDQSECGAIVGDCEDCEDRETPATAEDCDDCVEQEFVYMTIYNEDLAPKTITRKPDYPGAPITITIIESPPAGLPTTTKTEAWTGLTPTASTFAPDGTGPVTVISYTPTRSGQSESDPGRSTTTETEVWTGLTPTASTFTPDGTGAILVVSYIPSESNPPQSNPSRLTSTETQVWTGSTPTASTFTPDSTGPVVVISYTPSGSNPPQSDPGRPTTTETGVWTGSTPTASTFTPDGTGPVTVITYTPSISKPPELRLTRTSTTTWTGSTPSSLTVTPPGTGAIRVFVFLPPGTSEDPPPSSEPTGEPSSEPSSEPSPEPSPEPSSEPTSEPSSEPSSTPEDTSTPSTSSPSTDASVPSTPAESTPTPTPSTSTPPPESACATPSCYSNSGINVDLYENNYDDRDQGYHNYPDEGVGPDYYMDEDSQDSGVADSIAINGVTEGDQTVAGMTFDGNNHTLVYNGYFLPDTSGTYEFCIYSDNIVNMYFGSVTAFPCDNPDSAPADQDPFLGDLTFGDSTVCKSIDLEAGYYYPYRQVYGAYGYPNSLRIEVTTPTEQNRTDYNGFLFQATC